MFNFVACHVLLEAFEGSAQRPMRAGKGLIHKALHLERLALDSLGLSWT